MLNYADRGNLRGSPTPSQHSGPLERKKPASSLVTRQGGGGTGRWGPCDLSHDSRSAERRNGTQNLVRN